ncbi:sigma-70 family RNA polymerase sigma factor [Micromonospora sp. NPDC049175]|uniref:sigma-70 family RNA polymerase sigma factor n=1 Tax=Micromonospora sp. NPDC049175 TaxID=3364266 RepID=UPI00371A4DEC
MELIDHFEASRARLMSLAYRIVGSHHDAEDAVQAAWLRARSADPAQLVNLDGWLTTVTARLCLDQLRARHRRGELPLRADNIPDAHLATDEEFIRRENISRALLVVLGELSPPQRVAYVLHDLFVVPFDQVASVLDTTTVAAKKLASRARIRLRAAGPVDPPRPARQLEVIDAFLDAARGGDIARLVTLLAPDVVRTADLGFLANGAEPVVRGARAVAEETRAFVDRIAVAVPVLVDGRPGAVVAPGGHPLALIRISVHDGLVTNITIAPYERRVVSLPAAE